MAGLVVVGFGVRAQLAPRKAKPALILPPPAPILPRPNIIFILTDDLDYRSFPPPLGNLAPQLNWSTHVQSELIAQGVTFPNFFLNVSLCCPSRSSIMLGQYAHNHRVLTNVPANGAFDKFHKLGRESANIATWLHPSYRTGLAGKYLNLFPDLVDPTYGQRRPVRLVIGATYQYRAQMIL